MKTIDQEVKKAKAQEAQATLKEAIAKKFCGSSNPKVTIDLEEYLALKELSRDYGRLMRVVQDNADLNYDGTEIRTNDREITQAIKLLDPVFYEDLLRTLKEKENE